MDLNSVRELKRNAIETVMTMIEPAIVAAAARPQTGEPRRFISLGIAPVPGKGGYRLAIRLQREDADSALAAERLRELARDEVDVRFTGRIRKATSAYPFASRIGQNRLLRIGDSIGHYRVTAGTLGAFSRVRCDDNGPVHLLSNNHVIANENRSRMKDAVLQPGPSDGGKVNHDRVAGMARFIPLVGSPNTVDCAIAEIDPGVDYDPRNIPNLGLFSGGVASSVEDGIRLKKFGAASGLTNGRVTAFEVNDIVVGYSIGNLRFNEQIEVEGANGGPFAKRGDSGSLVVDGDRLAVGLVFATSNVGGTNGKGLTYVNPIRPVLDALNVDLIS
ncbi:chymotrypsin family serine protease [Paraburkholderia tropica]|uniref:hypothetical protein n=1 Tax=Paraburkholderia tropica TaxID=92647 RepID=UPI002AB28CF3|nr:hypothetical protein [Paraburkholderia tropica]